MLESGKCGEKPPVRLGQAYALSWTFLVYLEKSGVLKTSRISSLSYKVDRGAATAPITGPYPAPAAGPVDTVIGSLGRRCLFEPAIYKC